MVSFPCAIFSVCFLVFFSIANAKYYHSQLKYFNVKDYGAVADEKRDNSQVRIGIRALLSFLFVSMKI